MNSPDDSAANIAEAGALLAETAPAPDDLVRAARTDWSWLEAGWVGALSDGRQAA